MTNPNALKLYAAISAGSVVGSLLRWLVGIVLVNDAFPWATLTVNLTGSFAIGFLAGLTAPGARLRLSPALLHFATTGICGGYTTFSLFSLETLQMLQASLFAKAAFYTGLSVTTWLGAIWLGDACAGRCNRG